MVKPETVGRSGKTEGQPAHTREAKLGCVFTQTTWDKEGYPIRDPESTTYTGTIETAEEFGKRTVEASAAGAARKRRPSWATGPNGSGILPINISPARGRLSICTTRVSTRGVGAPPVYPYDEGKQKAWMKVHQKRLLDLGKIEKLVFSLRSIDSAYPEVADKLRTEADYFERNAERMRYPKFRRLHLFVGSGVIEAGCKTVIGSRLKKSGMFWTVRGANAIIALRCCHLNGRFEDYWEARRAA